MSTGVILSACNLAALLKNSCNFLILFFLLLTFFYFLFFSAYHRHPAAMATALNPQLKSAYFGHNENNIYPEIGICAQNDWCSNIIIKPKLRRVQIASTWDPSWYIFSEALGFQQLYDLNFKEINQSLTLKINSNDTSDHYPFGFYFDNRNNQSNDHLMVYVYSNQDQEMVLKDITINSGERVEIWRYGDADQAFCLSKNPRRADTYQPNLYGQASCEDVCSFKMLVTQFATDYIYQFDNYHSNVMRGGKTGQRFCKGIVKDAQITSVRIYNIVLLLK